MLPSNHTLAEERRIHKQGGTMPISHRSPLRLRLRPRPAAVYLVDALNTGRSSVVAPQAMEATPPPGPGEAGGPVQHPRKQTRKDTRVPVGTRRWTGGLLCRSLASPAAGRLAPADDAQGLSCAVGGGAVFGGIARTVAGADSARFGAAALQCARGRWAAATAGRRSTSIWR